MASSAAPAVGTSKVGVCSLKLRHGTYQKVTFLQNFGTFNYLIQFFFNHGHSTS
jgi:hypothetical protein